MLAVLHRWRSDRWTCSQSFQNSGICKGIVETVESVKSVELDGHRARPPEPGGFVKLAAHMNLHPELTIFRGFSALGIETLMLYQAQLSVLECKLRQVQDRNRKSDNESCRLFDRYWVKLAAAADLDPEGEYSEQFRLLMLIRDLKFQYDQAIFFHRETISMRRPHKRLLQDLRDWMFRSDRGNIKIMGPDLQAWRPGADSEEADLFTFENSTMDEMSRLVTYSLIDIFHNLIGRHWAARNTIKTQGNSLPLSNADICPTVSYSQASILKFTRTLTILLACMLPVGSIVILYSIENMTTRLGVMACLTGLFSLSMHFATMATLAEIFQATAAMAAVNVVFIASVNAS